MKTGATLDEPVRTRERRTHTCRARIKTDFCSCTSAWTYCAHPSKQIQRNVIVRGSPPSALNGPGARWELQIAFAAKNPSLQRPYSSEIQDDQTLGRPWTTPLPSRTSSFHEHTGSDPPVHSRIRQGSAAFKRRVWHMFPYAWQHLTHVNLTLGPSLDQLGPKLMIPVEFLHKSGRMQANNRQTLAEFGQSQSTPAKSNECGRHLNSAEFGRHIQGMWAARERRRWIRTMIPTERTKSYTMIDVPNDHFGLPPDTPEPDIDAGVGWTRFALPTPAVVNSLFRSQ